MKKYLYVEDKHMLSTLISASLGYADIAFFAILIIGLVVGLIRGFAKSFQGFFLAVTIILCSILLVGATFTKVRQIKVWDNIDNKIVASSQGWGQAFSEPLHQNEDGSFYVEIQDGGETQKVPLSSVGGIKGKLAAFLAQRFVQEVPEEGISLGQVLAHFTTNIVVAVASFIVFCIALGLICWIIRKIFGKMHDSENKAVKAIDKILGALISAALALIFLLCVLEIFHFFDNKLTMITDHIKASAITGYLYEHNPISTIFANIGK